MPKIFKFKPNNKSSDQANNVNKNINDKPISSEIPTVELNKETPEKSLQEPTEIGKFNLDQIDNKDTKNKNPTKFVFKKPELSKPVESVAEEQNKSDKNPEIVANKIDALPKVFKFKSPANKEILNPQIASEPISKAPDKTVDLAPKKFKFVPIKNNRIDTEKLTLERFNALA